MQSLNLQDVESVSGGNFVVGYAAGKILDWVVREVLAGHVDYASVAESQGTYYNTVGA